MLHSVKDSRWLERPNTRSIGSIGPQPIAEDIPTWQPRSVQRPEAPVCTRNCL